MAIAYGVGDSPLRLDGDRVPAERVSKRDLALAVLRHATEAGAHVGYAAAVTDRRGDAERAAVGNRSLVRIDGLWKRFPVRRTWAEMVTGKRRGECATVLRNVSLTVGEGEFFGLLGPNGAGKTTLFKILSGLILPDGGTARVAGFDVVSQVRRVRTVLTPAGNEERSLFWRISARENLRVYAALHGLRGGALAARIEEVLQAVELADTGSKMVGQFSSGMKQRLLIARALLGRPKLLLLDEPTRSLDPVSARNFRTFLREEIVGRQGCTVLLATHNAEEALGLCDRVGILHLGKLLRVGTPGRLMVEVSEQRYLVSVRDVDRAAFEMEVRRRGITAMPAETELEPGWVSARLQLEGGFAAGGDLITDLVRSGIVVGRFEPERVSLADLIERIVAEGAGNEGEHA